FRQASIQSLPVMGGASLMMLGAAFLEAFWSANATIEPGVRVAAGIVLWSLVLAYFALAGRSRAA
ncbi:MAG TPA: stage II sporulation protein M, partial [Fibrobacteria bacterium]|nr:stage II sporulation protein M [Fibrobacteria bacterium]